MTGSEVVMVRLQRGKHHNLEVTLSRRISPNWPLILVVLSWGFNFVSLKVLYREIEPSAVALMRFLAMWSMLVPLCVARGLSLRYQRTDVVRVLFAGFLAMGLYMVLFMEGLHLTHPAEGAIILATSPVLTYLLASALRQEKFSFAALGFSCIAFVGVAIVIFGGATSPKSPGGDTAIKGDLVLLVSAVVWATTVVTMRPLLKKYEATQLLTLSMPGGALVMIPYGLPALLKTPVSHVSSFGWLMFAQVSILSGVVGFACFYLGVKQVGATRATLYQYFVPPTAAFFAWLVMGKSLLPVQVLGLIVLLGGVVATTQVRVASAAATELK